MDFPLASATVVVIDDHGPSRTAVVETLNAAPSLRVVGDVSSHDDPLATIEELQPDVALVDVRLQSPDGISLCRELNAAQPDLATVIQTIATPELAELSAWFARSNGFVIKSIRDNQYVAALLAAASGELLAPPAAWDIQAHGERFGSSLDLDERHLLELVLLQHHNHEIAERLQLSPDKVQAEIAQLSLRLGLI